ncbi:MAG: hypothetical protein P1P88_07590 [Bacteroidales bacterium]|nr:hypothetical protein [Bacteroidales bacterium]
MNKLLTILTLFAAGCSEINDNSRVFNLKHDLGQISISLTSEFDTVETWIKKSDYHCGTKQFYRIANSRFDLHKSTNEYDFHHYWLFRSDHATDFGANGATLKEVTIIQKN